MGILNDKPVLGTWYGSQFSATLKSNGCDIGSSMRLLQPSFVLLHTTIRTRFSTLHSNNDIVVRLVFISSLYKN